MLRNCFLKSKFSCIKPPRVPKFCKHTTLASAGINSKPWLDTNTRRTPLITSIKDPPQNQHLAESCLGYPAEGIDGVLRGLSGERMGDFTPSSPGVTWPFLDGQRHQA